MHEDTIREQAIEAAYEAFVNVGDGIEDLVDAALAVAGPAYRAAALRDAADDFAVIPHPYEGGVTAWLRARADAELFSEAGP